jgi:hypothetical protein
MVTPSSEEIREAIDRVVDYLYEEEENYENRSADERANHIWNSVRILRDFADPENPRSMFSS